MNELSDATQAAKNICERIRAKVNKDRKEPTGNQNCLEGGYYFKNINFANSFLVRLDDKELNEDILKYNSDEYIREFDEVEDLKYL